MGFHTFDADRAAKLDDSVRSRFVSREELPLHLGVAFECVVVDLGSGTDLFIDGAAPHVGTLYAVDARAVMHDYYRKKGAPDNVELVTAGVASLPFDDDHLDTVFSTMIYHRFATDEALAEFARVVRPGGTVVVVDWSTPGSGEGGPLRDERLGLGGAVSALEVAGFTVTRGEIRRETFVCVAWR